MQFWTAESNMRHRFVTFANSCDAGNCLRLAGEIEPILHIRHLRSLEHYRIPKIPPTDILPAPEPVETPTQPPPKTLDNVSLTPPVAIDTEEGKFLRLNTRRQNSSMTMIRFATQSLRHCQLSLRARSTLTCQSVLLFLLSPRTYHPKSHPCYLPTL